MFNENIVLFSESNQSFDIVTVQYKCIKMNSRFIKVKVKIPT